MSKQRRNPEKGDILATIKTTMGDIKVILFPDAAPKAVENFTTHAENGYYNGIIFHRVIPDFMIQGGDPLGRGTGGESIWGRSFEDEFSPEYHKLRGALSMANAGPNTNGSQFFIVQADSVDGRFIPQMERLPEMFTPDSVEDYKAVGGTPWLDFRHTVFGQTVEGMDVVDAIAATKTDPNDRPVAEQKIASITVDTHGETYPEPKKLPDPYGRF